MAPSDAENTAYGDPDVSRTATALVEVCNGSSACAVNAAAVTASHRKSLVFITFALLADVITVP
jgi:hypothetical protein